VEKINEIRRLARESEADILILPEEYFGGFNQQGKFLSYSISSPLVKIVRDLAFSLKCGLVIGIIEKVGLVSYQSLLFIDEKGRIVGKERKYNLARYEIYEYGLKRNARTELKKGVYRLGGTSGTGIFCWEVYDLQLKVTCDAVKPDWIADVIKFPLNYDTVYAEVGGKYRFKGLTRSEYIYSEWIQRLKGLTQDTLSIVIASCNANFSLADFPEDPKPLACIVHPNGNIPSERFNFGPKNLIKRIIRSREPRTKLHQNELTSIALTNEVGSFVKYEMKKNEIDLLRMGPEAFEKAFGRGTYPTSITTLAKAWRVRHLLETYKGSPGRFVKIARDFKSTT